MKQSPKMPAEKRHAQLVKAALKVFLKKGYAGATTAEIAKAAKLTKGALYFHFKSKEDIFFAVIRERNEAWANAFDDYIENIKDPDEFVEVSINEAFNLIKNQMYFTIDLWQRANKIPKIKGYLMQEHFKVEEKIVDYLVLYSDLKQNEARNFIRLLHAMIDGVMIRQMLCFAKDDLETLKENIILISKLYLRKDKISG
ncbi:MAG: TetR/AcrR family transcriptional regulator [Candidatus Zixiibacteriota bacterium]